MISKKCDYALRAILELALRDGKGPVTIGELARARNIPVRFLEAIMRQLKQSGLADSARGKEGGYSLARPAQSLCVGDVIEIFEGRIDQRNRGHVPDVFEGLWKEADAAVQAVYRNVTFGDLAEREIHRQDAEAENFSI